MAGAEKGVDRIHVFPASDTAPRSGPRRKLSHVNDLAIAWHCLFISPGDFRDGRLRGSNGQKPLRRRYLLRREMTLPEQMRTCAGAASKTAILGLGDLDTPCAYRYHLGP